MRQLAILLLTAAAASSQSLDDSIRAAIANFPGKTGIYAKNLDTGADYGLNPDEPVRAASTIKVPILAATYAAVAAGQLSWAQPVVLRAADKVSGAGILTEFSNGAVISLRDLTHLMIVLSDNTATNLVLDRVTADYVNLQMDKLGLKHTRSMRKILGSGQPAGFSKAGKLKENERFGLGSSTPREMAALFEKLEQGAVVSKGASAEMLELLRRQQDQNGIQRRLGAFQIANKTGALDHLRSDVGIVYSPGGRIAMAITVDEIPAIDWSVDNPGYLLIARVAELLVRGLAKPAAGQ
jgi:beta-lactamase class A